MTAVTIMRSRPARLAAVLLIGTSLVTGACTNSDGSQANKTTVGAAGGAAAGGLLAAALGGKTAAVVAGTLIGGLFGGAVGASLDQRDRELAHQTASRSLETAQTGTTTTWKNPDSGHEGTFTPTKTYQRNDGQYCREYQQTVVVGGEEQKAYGTACRQPDGQWKIIS
ncbi:MAG: RT0821/Lpp0805 family surface protein [Pseudomonadota bacterium]|nr:RT0821/Lpp0805 family surface protein [Pseudomonadota bacterium]